MRHTCPLCHDLEDGPLAPLYSVPVIAEVRRTAHEFAALESKFVHALAHDELVEAADILTNSGLADRLILSGRYGELGVRASELAHALGRSCEGACYLPVLNVLHAESFRWLGFGAYQLAVDGLERVPADELAPVFAVRRLRVKAEAMLYIDRGHGVELLQEVAHMSDPAAQEHALVARSGIAVSLLRWKRPEEARTVSLRAFECARACQSEAGMEEHLDRAAAAAADLGCYAQALALERDALVLSARRGNRRGLRYRYRLLSEILAHLGDFQGALALFLLAEDASLPAQDPHIHLIFDLERRLRALRGHDVFETARAAASSRFRRTLKHAMEQLFADGRS